MTSARARTWIPLAIAGWLGLAATGLFFVWRFDNAPGAAAHAPARWPGESELARATDRPTLLLIAHPQCSCTVASLNELAEVLARAPEQPKTFVVFLEPDGFGDEWVEGDLWKKASRLPGVIVVRDLDGREAQRFGAATSGQTFLFDADGTLAFSGGITGARSHEGDNAGRQSLVSLLTHASTSAPSTNVFGCPLFNAGT